jgi:hypothetical protein
MSNAPITTPPAAPPPEATTAAGPVDYAELPATGVRRVLDAYEERDLQRVRWGAVIAGLFLAIGTQLLLGMLGVAIGLSAVDPRAASPLSGLGTGAGLWFAISWLVAMFIGGFTAARLAGTIRRGDGALNGLLTWATALVLALWLAGSTAAGAMGTATEALGRGPRMGMPPPAQLDTPAERREAAGRLESAARASVDDLERGAWATFGGTVLSLLAALAGGAAGAVGMPRRDRPGRGGFDRARDRLAPATTPSAIDEKQREADIVDRDIRRGA